MKNPIKIPVRLTSATLVLLIFLLHPLFEAWAQGNYAIQANIIYRFEINKRAIENRTLDIATELLSLGSIVK